MIKLVDKKNNNVFLGIIILALILIFGGNAGWLKNSMSITNAGGTNGLNTIPYSPSSIDPNYQVTVSLNPYSMCVGSFTEGKISSNMPNAVCSIYVSINDAPVILYKNVLLTSTGSYVDNVQVNSAGKAVFRVVCYTGSSYAISNSVTLSTNFCSEPPQPPVVPSCTDSDGGQDNQYLVYGTCESSVTQTGMADSCVNGLLWEYYCDTDFTCKKSVVTCENGWVCIGGKCAQPRCQDILFPTSQASCNPGYCNNGDGCDFVEATLHSPARCECVT